MFYYPLFDEALLPLWRWRRTTPQERAEYDREERRRAQRFYIFFNANNRQNYLKASNNEDEQSYAACGLTSEAMKSLRKFGGVCLIASVINNVKFPR